MGTQDETNANCFAFFRTWVSRSDVSSAGETARQGRENFVLAKTKLFLTPRRAQASQLLGLRSRIEKVLPYFRECTHLRKWETCTEPVMFDTRTRGLDELTSNLNETDILSI